jgi:hypothetical protein
LPRPNGSSILSWRRFWVKEPPVKLSPVSASPVTLLPSQAVLAEPENWRGRLGSGGGPPKIEPKKASTEEGGQVPLNGEMGLVHSCGWRRMPSPGSQ